jgi:GNAT superfamily N-acetyltransferase
MIAIRTLEEDSEQLSKFCLGVWKRRYADRMPVPLWSAPFFDWELLSGDSGSRDFLVAAYDKSRLVGILPARPVQFHVGERRIAGTFGSFFSVDPEYDGQGVALKLHLEQRRRHKERGVPLSTGFVFLGSALAMGKDFWFRLRTIKVVSRIGMWVRLIDHRAVSRFECSRRDSWATRLVGLFQGPPRPAEDEIGIRPFRDSDLPDCLRLVNDISDAADFGLIWDEHSLSRQLSFHALPRTIVAEQDGRVKGFANYFPLDILGHETVRAGVIDVLSIAELPFARQKDLLRATLTHMREDGCHLALLLRVPGYARRLMYGTGFVPQPTDYWYVNETIGPDSAAPETRRIHVVWR